MSDALCTLPGPTAQLASAVVGVGAGIGRGLLCTLLVWIASLSTWLGEHGRDREFACVLPVVLASLSVPEEEPMGIWACRSKQEHAGCVAIMKLCAASPAAVLSACPLAQLGRRVMLQRMIFAGATGAVVGGAGVVAGSLIQLGRMPPPAQAAAASGFMGFMFGVGSIVRTR